MDQIVDRASIRTPFETLEDPRHTRNRKRVLVEVIVIGVAGILCGCDGPTAIHRWATERHEWLRQHLTLANGIPSRDGLHHVLIARKPEAFQKGFRAWIVALETPRRHRWQELSRLARRSEESRRVAHRQRLGQRGGHRPGQVATEEKSNEITAIPERLGQIERKDTLITIDAMGCQKEIVTQIVQGGEMASSP